MKTRFSNLNVISPAYIAESIASPLLVKQKGRKHPLKPQYYEKYPNCKVFPPYKPKTKSCWSCNEKVDYGINPFLISSISGLSQDDRLKLLPKLINISALKQKAIFNPESKDPTTRICEDPQKLIELIETKNAEDSVQAQLKLESGYGGGINKNKPYQTAAGKGPKKSKRKIGKTGIRTIPNCKDIKITDQGLDDLALEFGIMKNYPKKIKITPYLNRSMNRGLISRIEYISQLAKRKEYELAGKHCTLLLRNSDLFFILGVSHVFPHYHRDKNLLSLINLRKEVQQIAQLSHEIPIEFVRVYIPKANGKLRPLGVPTHAGRIYLHMLNQLLLVLFADKMPSGQHGFQPNKGTLSCGRELIEKVIHQRNIYEFDLKGFFDNVNLNYISQKIEEGTYGKSTTRPTLLECKEHIENGGNKDGYRNRLSYYILGGNNVSNGFEGPNYPLTMNYSEALKELNGSQNQKKEAETPPLWQIVSGLNSSQPLNLNGKIINEMSPPDIDIENQRFHCCTIGVPQGSPTSPILSLITLEDYMKGKQTLMYADDGLGYSNETDSEKIEELCNPPSELLSEQTGARVNLDKSHGVKKDGKGLKELKFLGLIYNGETDKFRADTRKGSTLELPEKILEFIKLGDSGKKHCLDRHLSRMTNTTVENSCFHGGAILEDLNSPQAFLDTSSISNLASSSLTGFITSRLYNGEGNSEIIQDFSYKFRPQSLMGYIDKGNKKRPKTKRIKLTTFNSTSYAAKALMSVLEGFNRKDNNKSLMKELNILTSGRQGRITENG